MLSMKNVSGIYFNLKIFQKYSLIKNIALVLNTANKKCIDKFVCKFVRLSTLFSNYLQVKKRKVMFSHQCNTRQNGQTF